MAPQVYVPNQHQEPAVQCTSIQSIATPQPVDRVVEWKDQRIVTVTSTIMISESFVNEGVVNFVGSESMKQYTRTNRNENDIFNNLLILFRIIWSLPVVQCNESRNQRKWSYREAYRYISTSLFHRLAFVVVVHDKSFDVWSSNSFKFDLAVESSRGERSIGQERNFTFSIVYFFSCPSRLPQILTCPSVRLQYRCSGILQGLEHEQNICSTFFLA